MGMITGEDRINLARLATLRAMLKLEIHGMKRRGRSAYAIVKSELGFKGNRERVLAQLTDHIQQKEKDCGIGN